MSGLDKGVSVIDAENDGMGCDCIQQSVFVAIHPGWTDDGGAGKSVLDRILA